ncbi:MAG: U32 family peptidase [Hyphomicrobiaceae bacterium]
MQSTTLTIGPVLFNWPSDRWRDFYYRIADEAPVDHVCIGEVVCSKRQVFFNDVLPIVIERLERAGKEVLLSSLALPTHKREIRHDAQLINGRHMLEVNDVSLLPAVAGRPHAIGPFVNVYNEGTLGFLVSRGARLVALPPELPRSSFEAIVSAVPDATIEAWAFGRTPLAISARCYHARVHGHSKDSCQFVCERDTDGMTIETLDNEPFLVINGVQTLSYAFCNLLREATDLVEIGVSSLRLSPHTCDMVAISQLFRDVLDGRRDANEAFLSSRDACPSATFSNGFIHGRPGAMYV